MPDTPAHALTRIPVPKPEHVESALDGIGLTAIDTDPDAGLIGLLNSYAFAPLEPGQARIEVLGVLPVTFHGTTPGYVVVTYTRARDPRATKEGQ